MKKIILLISIVLILSSMGCVSDKRIGPEEINYHSGNKGLEMNIIKNLPPDEIIKENSFVIAVELVNSGAFDINEGKITFNYDSKYLSIGDQQRTFNLNGKQQGYPEGERKVMNFQAKNIGTREASEETPISFTVSAQYHYETSAYAEVCINPDIYSVVKTKDICDIKTISLNKGQGAPVAVTSIEQVPSPTNEGLELSFLIHISNKDDGEVIDKLKIKNALLSNQKLECEKITSFDNQKDNIVQCKTILKNLRGAYVAPLTITLEYDYKKSVDKKLKAVDLLLKSKKI